MQGERPGPARTDWCSVPAGTAVIGTDSADIPAVLQAHSDLDLRREWLDKESPQHEVQVPSFAMSRLLVTNVQFLDFAESENVDWSPIAAGNHPAVVSFELAQQFATWISDIEAAAVRLPTEVEWERAARGGDAREFPWGDTFTPNHANIGRHSMGTTTAVGSYPKGASSFGPLDLAGNVEEWTSTTYEAYPGAPHPVASEAGALDPHVTRGGSWNGGEDLARCARRHARFGFDPIGFRLVRTDTSTL